MEVQDTKSTLQVTPRNEEKIKKIWKTALILLVITLAEFVMAFTMDRGILLYSLFIILTLCHHCTADFFGLAGHYLDQGRIGHLLDALVKN